MTLPLAVMLAATLCTWKPAATGNPINRFFSGAKVECREAKAGPLGRDRVNAFVRDGDRIGIEVPLTYHLDEAELQSMLERARPTVRVKVQGLAEGDSLFAYVPETTSVIPLVTIDGAALVPTETTFVLIATHPSPSGRRCREAADEGPCKSESTVARNDAPHPASGHPLPAGEGFSGVSAPVRVKDGDITLSKRALIGWLEPRLPKDNIPKSPPIVMLDGKRTPDARLRIGAMPLVIFHDVNDGKHELTLRGDGWKSQTVAIETSGITLMKAPLIATPSRNLSVRWTLLNDPATLAPKDGACGPPEPPKITGPLSMTVLDCPGMHPNAGYTTINISQCREAASVTLPDDQRHGRAELHDLASGPYLLRFSRAKLPDLWQSIVVPDDRDGDVQANVEYFRLFGTITRARKPVRASLSVSDGETVSGDDGKYELTVAGSRIGNRVMVVPCDTAEEYHEVREERPVANTRLDIDIPENVLRVEVVDAADGKPIVNANVAYSLLQTKEKGSSWYSGNIGVTDEHGRFELKQNQADLGLRICAYREEYENKCADDFRFGEQREVVIRLALTKLDFKIGKVIAGPINAGVLYWYSRDGVRLERATVKEDGTFKYTKAHAPGEIVTFISSSHPLYAFVQPVVNAGQPFTFALPSANVRSFEVALDDSAQGPVVWLSLIVGDVPVPVNVLSEYGARHNSRASIRKGQTVPIRDILEVEPISVVAIPLAFFEANNVEGRDIALVPAAGSLRRYRVGNESRITVNDH